MRRIIITRVIMKRAQQSGSQTDQVWRHITFQGPRVVTRSQSSTTICFWRFMFLWVNLALLNLIESFSRRGRVVQATKSKEESCSFLAAIGRRSCGPLSELSKNRHVGKPKLRLKRIETVGRYATVRFVTLLWLALRLTFESRLSLPCMHIVGHATESKVHASGKFCLISDPLRTPPPQPLSLSLRVTRFEKKKITSAKLDNQKIQAKVR